MNEFEKVDRLRERASCTYEEARDALNEANGDLLDAMVILEQKGKTTQPQVSTFRTTYEEHGGYERVEPETADDTDAGERFSASLKRFLRVVGRKLRDNEFCAYNGRKERQKGKPTIQIPVWLAIVILLLCWGWLVPLMVILMFFGWRYGFSGKDNLSEVNDILDRAGNAAENAREHVREEFRKEEP